LCVYIYPFRRFFFLDICVLFLRVCLFFVVVVVVVVGKWGGKRGGGMEWRADFGDYLR
jgi:hypothetical protein